MNHLRPARAWLLLWLLFGLQLPPTHAQPPLDGYVQEALKSNLVLQDKRISLEKSLLALKESRALFMPSLEFGATYTYAAGGRNIDLPVGDLLNPVYSTLNQLTGTNLFPQIANQSVQLFPKNFYDARFRTTLPIYNYNILYNNKIQQQAQVLSAYEVDLYQRTLVLQVKEAYYDYLSALKAVRIYQSAENIVKQNLKVNQSLLDNGKGLMAQVLRAESELQRVVSQYQKAELLQRNAKAYFNFLLNRALDADIDTLTQSPEGLVAEATLTPSLLAESRIREEVKLLRANLGINQTILTMKRSYWQPRLGTYLDLGSQGFDFQLDRRTLYLLAGVQLDIPIFNGLKNRIAIQQAKLDITRAQLNLTQTEKAFALSQSNARRDLDGSQAMFKSAQKGLESAKSYFKLVNRGYEEGANSLIEFIDGREQLTNAELTLNLQAYQVLKAAAKLERESANFNIPTTSPLSK